ncbi:glycoside hydrolase family 9 [Alteromonas sp. KUL42]|nr:glycoside hydrolase family 9 [Alteromonas sp. KUL42]
MHLHIFKDRALCCRPYYHMLIASICCVLVIGCSEDNSRKKYTEDQVHKPVQIKMSQVGYLPNSSKLAIVSSPVATHFEIKRKIDHAVRYEGMLEKAKKWPLSHESNLFHANFGDFTEQDEFYLEIEGIPSMSFTIGNSVYVEPHRAAIKSFYFNRSGTSLAPAHAGKWARPVGHLDEEVSVHSSATTTSLDSYAVLASKKGWYDAGDYGKYTVNSAIATYTLLAAYEHNPQYYDKLITNIPETKNDLPDLLDEVRWNLDWLATMQRYDGAAFHKLTTLEWPGKVMPHEDVEQRFVIGVSTSASLDLAATLAVASRVYQEHEPELAKQWLVQAEKAWEWAQQNPDTPYIQPNDVKSGEYGDSTFDDEFFWATAELYIATENPRYLDYLSNSHIEFTVPGWADVETLGLISLLTHGKDLLPSLLYEKWKQALLSLADAISNQITTSPYRIPMEEADFVWGSNSVLLNKAMVLLTARRFTNNNKGYLDIVHQSIAYIFGTNPTGFSFVTGIGNRTPMSPHHRISESDSVEAPIPGMLVGGPHSGHQDKCSYPYPMPADSYIDNWCSFSTNEVAINWNAPLVYVLGELNALLDKRK